MASSNYPSKVICGVAVFLRIRQNAPTRQTITQFLGIPTALDTAMPADEYKILNRNGEVVARGKIEK